jgi:hypothetical protein
MAAAFAREGGYGAPESVIHLDSSHPDYIVVPDGQFLFAAEFHRAGPDLILTGHDGRHEIIPGYFATEHRPAFIAPNGARLSPHLVDLLAGSPAPNQYAQAQSAPPPPDSIGKVEKVVGNVTVIRNGVSVALNAGDAVYKNDVIQTGLDSKAGIGFPDGTALQLLADTRMALDEYSYDPNGHSNSAVFSYVSGTFGFFAGKVAHTGDMKIDTPIATMGIRGTTGVMSQYVSDGAMHYWQTIYDDPGTNRSGTWDDFRQNADGSNFVAITVSQPGEMTVFTLQGPGLPPLITVIPLPASYGQIGAEIVEELAEIIQELNVNPHSLGSPGSPENPIEILPPEFIPGIGNGPQPISYISIIPPGGGPPVIVPIVFPPISPPGTETGFIWPSGLGTWDTASGWLGDAVPTALIDTVTIESGTVQYGSSGGDNYIIQTLTIDSPGQLDIVSGSLNIQDGLDDGGALVVGGDPPALTVNGPVTVEAGGKMIAHGDGAVINVTLATVENSGTIAARHGGDIEFIADALVTNESGGKIKSVGFGSVVDFTGVTEFDNAGVVRAKDGGGIFFVDSTVTNEGSGIDEPTGLIVACGCCSTIEFSSSDLFNYGAVIAKYHGIVRFEDAQVVNEAGGMIKAADGGKIWLEDTTVTNSQDAKITAIDCGTVSFENHSKITNDGGLIVARQGGLVVFDDVKVSNEAGGIIEAGRHGTVVIADTTVRNADGTIEAIGACAVVALVDATIKGGTLTTGNPLCIFDGVIESAHGCNTLQSVTLEDAIVKIDCCSTLLLDADTAIDGTVTLIGPGVVALGAGDEITGVHSTDATLQNDSNIRGGGDIGTGKNTLTLINEACGTIVATDGFCDPLVINTGNKTITNDGLMEAARYSLLDIESQLDNFGGVIASHHGEVDIEANVHNEDGGTIEAKHGGTVTLDHVKITNDEGGLIEAKDDCSLVCIDCSTIDNAGTILAEKGGTIAIKDTTIHNAEGLIEAIGCGAVVDLVYVTIEHGTLETSDHGLIQTAFGNSTFDAVTIADGSEILVNEGTSLTLQGTIHNHGTIDVDGCEGAQLIIGGTVTLDGKGTVTLEGASDDITGMCTGALDNVNDTISGVGTIGGDAGPLTFDNEQHGTVDANVSGQILVFDPGEATNAGTLQASHGGILEIEVDVDNTSGTIAAKGGHSTVEIDAVTITDGTLSASGTNSVIDLEGTTVNGSTLETDTGGVIETISGTSTVSGVTIESGSFIDTDNGTFLDLQATTTLDGSGTVTFEGRGTFAMGAGAEVAGSTATGTVVTLDNLGTISGEGNIGAGGTTMTFDNGGTVNADINGATLTIDTGTNEIVNTGVFQVSNGGILDVDSTVNNMGGLIKVGGGASTADFTDAVTGGNATIKGGTLEFDSTSNVIVTFDNGTGDSPKYGVLDLTNAGTAAGTFSGQIVDFSGTGASLSQSDAIDLAGFKIGKTTIASDVYNSGTGLTTLKVADVSAGLSTTLIFQGNYVGDFVLKGDGNGGTDIFDPPANSATNPPVTIGGPGNDNFFFHPGLGGEGESFTPWHENAAFENSAHTETVQQLQSLVEEHHAAFMDFAHHDSISPPGMTADQFHAMLHTAVDLH